MSFLRKYPVALVLLSITIVGVYIAANAVGGFWDTYAFVTPANNISSFDVVDDLNQEAENLVCDVNPEKEACKNVPSSSLSEDENFIQRMVKGSYAGLVTFIKLFGLPKQIVIDILQLMNVPTKFIVAAYTILLLVIIMTIIIFIFTRSDTPI